MFADRKDAGQRLAEHISDADLIIAIPRGGVPVGAVIAAHLKVPLTIVAVKKVTAPSDPEFARGAASAILAEADPDVARGWVDTAQERACAIEERFGTLPLEGRRVVLVDDGAATGRTFLLAIETLRARGAARITAALPVASREAAAAIRRRADETIILETPEPFFAVGAFYQLFDQTSDDEVKKLLEEHT
jgi:putative phosphoribosyl transferase